MKHFRHPATIIASIALFAALAGGAGAAMTTLISGSQIVNGSIPLTKLSPSAISALQVTGVSRSDGGGGGADCPLNTTTTPTWCGKPATVLFDPKTAVLVNGDVDLASSDGNGITAQLGVCYAQWGSSQLVVVQHVYPEFTAPANSFFSQGVTGVAGRGLVGWFDVGVCLLGETDNAANGRFAITMLTVETRTGITKLGPN